MLLAQRMRLAASRTFCTAGSSNAIRTPIIAMTTSSSTSVKPLRDERRMSIVGNRLTVVACGQQSQDLWIGVVGQSLDVAVDKNKLADPGMGAAEALRGIVER